MNNEVTCRTTGVLTLRINRWKQREPIKKYVKKKRSMELTPDRVY